MARLRSNFLSDLQEIIDVDFDFFDLDPIDFHAVKKLLSQLFSADAELLDLSGFSDVIINQTVGSTVKVDGKESDPYALLTVVNSNMHKVKKFTLCFAFSIVMLT
jgi:protein BCP1